MLWILALSLYASRLVNHRLNGSSSPVLTATSLSYEKAKNSTPHRIKTPDLIEIKFGTVDWIFARDGSNDAVWRKDVPLGVKKFEINI